MSYLTPNEVAKLLRCRRSKVINWITSGRLPALNVGDKRPSYRIAAADLDSLKHQTAVAPKRRTIVPAPKSYF